MLDELRRRNVHRVALAYLAAAWLLIQVVETLLPAFDWSGQVLRIVVIAAAIGFVPAVVLAWKFEWTPEGIRRDSDIEPNATESRLFDRAITVMLVVALSYFAVDKFILEPATESPVLDKATESTVSDALVDEFRDRSILVVPFLSLSADPEQEYFADGVTEEIRNLLARIEELRVISGPTSRTFKGKDIDVAEVREKLDVSHILNGSVRTAGDTVNVSVELSESGTDTTIWSHSYEEVLDDLLEVQNQIALAVAEYMHLTLLDFGSPHEGINPEAYELYLKASGRFGESVTREVEKERVKLLERALDIEPDYLPALYNLAFTIYLNNCFAPDVPGHDDPVQECRQRVLGHVERMVEIAPDSPYVSNWRAHMAIEWYNDYVAAAPWLEKTMRFANRTDIHIWYKGAMELLAILGREEEAMVLGQYYVSRNPASSRDIYQIASAYRAIGRHEDAARLYGSQETWGELGTGDLWIMGASYLGAGMPEEALQAFERIPADADGMSREYARAFALYSLGRLDEFHAYLDERIAAYPANSSAESIARLYAWSNNPDEAFRWLEQMVEDDGPTSVGGIKTDLYEPIKSDPRWDALLRRYGFEDPEVLNIPFDPEYPPTLQKAVDAVRAR